MFDQSPFRRQLGFQPASNPIGPYAMIWFSYPPDNFMPIANVIPLDEGHERATVEPRYVVSVKPDGWDERSHGPRQRFY